MRMRGFFVSLRTTLAAGWLAIGVHAADVAPKMLLLDGAAAGPDLLVVGELGTILRSSDQARTWQAVVTPARATLTGIAFAEDNQHGWAVGHDALILGTADAGRTWTKQFQGANLQDSFLDVLALDARRAIAVGAYGLYCQTTDGGKTWEQRKIGEEDYHFNRISRGPTDTLYLAGEHGTLLRSTDHGAKWTKLAAPYDGSFYGVLPLAQRILIAHGLRGRVYRSADDGVTWTQVETPQAVLLAAGTKLKSNYFILAGHPRALFVSRDYGKTIVPWNATLTTAVAEMLELTDGSILALGEAGATVLPKP